MLLNGSGVIIGSILLVVLVSILVNNSKLKKENSDLTTKYMKSQAELKKLTESKNEVTELKETEKEKAKVTVIDFSQMTEADIEAWCKTNKVFYETRNDYSDTIDKGGFISQSVEANGMIEEWGKITLTYSLGKEPTLGERNALSKAKSYLDYSAFSYKGLIEQLEYEGFSKEESTYGADNCGADWNEQAAKKAKSYMDHSSFSKSGLIDQLEYEGFTNEQAQYGVKAVGY